MAERNVNNALWVPVAAGLFGAGLALLFAPRSGRETRDKLRVNYEELKDRADNKLALAREKVDESLEEAKALKSRLAGAIKKDAASERKNEFNESAPSSYADETSLINWEGEV